MNELLPIVMEVGRFNLTCMELLDRANTETFGDPVPVSVSLTVEKGPFIVVTGHDLEDIKQLLEQTKDKGINIYTHGEMLPAHAYPELKKYPHLKGLPEYTIYFIIHRWSQRLHSSHRKGT